MRHRSAVLLPFDAVLKEHRLLDISVIDKEESKILKGIHISEHLLDMLWYAGVEHYRTSRISSKHLKKENAVMSG